jgi:hypothetical protein
MIALKDALPTRVIAVVVNVVAMIVDHVPRSVVVMMNVAPTSKPSGPLGRCAAAWHGQCQCHEGDCKSRAHSNAPFPEMEIQSLKGQSPRS